MKNVEICNLNSDTDDLINTLFKYSRSNKAKINESLLKIVCSTLIKIVSDREAFYVK